jgi:hypothetical protein
MGTGTEKASGVSGVSSSKFGVTFFVCMPKSLCGDTKYCAKCYRETVASARACCGEGCNNTEFVDRVFH